MTAESSIVSGLAGRYATALLDLVQEQKHIDETLAEINALAAIIDASPELQRLIRSPVIARDDQGKAMLALMRAAGIGGLAAKFVGLVIDNRRLFLLPQMISAFRVLVSQHKGEVAAEVTSAKPLGGAQVDTIRAKLAAAMRHEVSLSTRVDPRIIGGLIVRVGSRMVDSSLRTKLFNLQNAMKENA